MAKTTAATQPNVGALQLGPRPVQCDVTPETWERCRRDLHVKLARAIQASPELGDVGIISKIVADIRALDLVEPIRVPAPVEPVKPDAPDVAERKAAASDPALMQAFNEKVARKESLDAAKAGD
jgi:hypothetical protein